MEVLEGQLAQVSCAVVNGDDPITIQWYKDHSPLIPSSKFVISDMDSKLSILLLRSVSAEHTGSYTCSAFNPVGQSEYSSNLFVKGKSSSKIH